MKNRNIKALVIGVSDYGKFRDTPDLPCGENDARLAAEAFSYGLCAEDDNIITLKGTVTRKMFIRSVRILISGKRSDDIFLFYFSGHGLVNSGMHYLVFSDGVLETQSVIDIFSKCGSASQVLFLDCCMSGNYTLDAPVRLEAGKWLDDLLLGGTSVFSSGRSYELSFCEKETGSSLFTVFLWNAVINRCFLFNGSLSLDTLRVLIGYEALAWNEKHPDLRLHPVFRSNEGAGISFRIYEKNERRDGRVKQKELYEDHDIIIDEVIPVHVKSKHRYVVKVILKHAVLIKELEELSETAADEVVSRYIMVSDDLSRRASEEDITLYICYGHSRYDVYLGNYEFRAEWSGKLMASDNEKEPAVRSGNTGEITSNISPAGQHKYRDGCVNIVVNEDYPVFRKIAEDNITGTDDMTFRLRNIMRSMIDIGESVIQIYYEYLNGTVSEWSMLYRTEPLCAEADKLYLKMADLPFPPEELSGWFDTAMYTAGDIQDISVIITERVRRISTHPEKRINKLNGNTDRKPDDVKENLNFNRRMDNAVRRFHCDLSKLFDEEKKGK